MKRRIGKECAETAVFRAPCPVRIGFWPAACSGRRRGAFFQEDYGTRLAEQQFFFRFGYETMAPDLLDRGKHDGERFFFPDFSASQPAYRGFICCIYREVKAAQALYGQNGARFEQFRPPFAAPHPGRLSSSPPAFPAGLAVRIPGRRSAARGIAGPCGSSYSRRHSGHMAKRAMVVLSRS